MDIRRLINLLENIEKKSDEKGGEDFDAYDAADNSELDTPTGNQHPKKHSGGHDKGHGTHHGEKHSKHGSKEVGGHGGSHGKEHETRAQKLDREFSKVDSGDDAADNGGDYSEFKNMAGSLGDGLYVVSPWMYSKDYENSWEQVLGYNNSIMHEIENVARKTDSNVDSLTSVSDRQITQDRMLVCAIFNEKTNKIFVLKASFKIGARFYPDSNTLMTDGYIEKSQMGTLNGLLSVVKKWSESVPEWYTARDATVVWDEPKEHKAWHKNELELLDTLQQKNTPDDLGPEQDSGEIISKWSDEKKQEYKEKSQAFLQYLLSKRTSNKDTEPREKR